MDSVLMPLSVMKHLWWILPLLSAALGTVLGRLLPGKRTLAARGTSVCLLLAVSGILIWREKLMYSMRCLGILYALGFQRGTDSLLLAVIAVGCAVYCAFRPTRSGCGVAVLGAVLWLVCTSDALFGVFYDTLSQISVELLLMSVLGMLAVVLAFMGFLGTNKVAAVEPSEPQEIPPAPPQPTASVGCLTILCGSFAGQQLPVPAGEELTLGGDAAQCHLILDQPGIPPCLCSVRWLEGRNTYLVSCHAPDGLLLADSSCAPSGSTTEVFPGTVCYLPATGIPVVQLG